MADAAPFDELVARASRGDRPSLETLMPLVYGELRRLAAHYLRGERPGQTLQPTALVHEAYLRLLKDRPDRWQNRAHFCAIAAHSMRQILIERARARDALKRGGGQPRVTFDESLPAAADGRSIDLAGARRRARATGRARRRPGADRGAPLLRRPHDRRNRRGDGLVARHREATLGPGARVARPGAGCVRCACEVTRGLS